ncbi:iron ABC transporter permease, partial [Corynebacterium sanguinis]|nr:iron ABC transporter permease [Corynebacterium sanguinis]
MGSVVRNVGAFQTSKSKRRYFIALGVMVVLAVVFTAGLLAWDNPVAFGTRAYWLIAERRLNAVIAMAVVAVCQGVATVAFQTVTNNRILTPSIM